MNNLAMDHFINSAVTACIEVYYLVHRVHLFVRSVKISASCQPRT